MMQLRIIGHIRTSYRSIEECPGSPPGDAEPNRIELVSEYAPALDGIEAASHLLVLYWLGEADRSVLRAATRVDSRIRGVFANRAPTRPTPIAVATVRLIGREADTLLVSSLDCLDRTPLLDIKPYVRQLDCVPDAAVEWITSGRSTENPLTSSPQLNDHAERSQGGTMTLEQNKRVAYEFFARFSASDLAGALATMTDDATWLIPGKPDRMPTAGLYSKERITRLFQAMLNQLRNGLKMTVTSAVAEGDRVALEVESQGDLNNGRLYRQQYHLLLEFRAGKICAVREYLDTQHAYDVWMAAA